MKTAEEFAENYLEENEIDPDNVEYIHLLDMMERFAKKRVVEFVFTIIPSERDEIAKYYDKFITEANNK